MRTYKATWIAADGTRGDSYWMLNTSATIEQMQAAVMEDMHNRYGNTDYINAGHVEVK